MTGWDGFNSKIKEDNDQPSEYDMISSRIQDAEYSNNVSRQNADPNKGLGDNVNVDLIRKIISEISNKIKEARESGKYETKYPISFLKFPLTRPRPSQKELEIVCDMLIKKGYGISIHSKGYTFIHINWMLIENPIVIK